MSSKEDAAKSNGSTEKSMNSSTVPLEMTSGNTFKMTKFQIIKNVLVVSFGFLFLFTSFQSLSNLQSSLYKEEGLGTIGLSVIYAALVVSCMFLPPITIACLGCKWTVALSMICYIAYMLANFFATWVTIIPAAIILGLGAAPLWSAKYQKLIVPITVYSGIEQAFITGDYTASFVSCTLGIWNVGFVMICYGVVDAACSFIFGRLVQYVGHIPFFVLAFIVHGGCQIAMLLWPPSTDAVYIFYILAALWGLGDAVIQTQINALYGFLFTDNTEAAFANYRLWESIGFIIAFGYSGFLATRVKLAVCLAFLCVGMFFYGVVEVAYRRLAADKTYEDIQTRGQPDENYSTANGKRDKPYEDLQARGQPDENYSTANGKRDKPYEDLQARGQPDENYSTANGKRDKPYEDLQARGQPDENYSTANGKRDKPYEDLQARGQPDENYSRINGVGDIALESTPKTERSPGEHCIPIGNYLQFYETLMKANLRSGKMNFLHSFEDYLTRTNQDQTSRQYDYPSFISDEPVSKGGADAMDIYPLGEKGRVCMVASTSVMTSDFWNTVVENNIRTIVALDDAEGDVELNKSTRICFKQVLVEGVNERYLSGIRFVQLQLKSENKDRSMRNVLYIAATFQLDEELLVNVEKLAIIYVHGVKATLESAEQNVLIHTKATKLNQHGILYGVFSVLHHLDETGFFDLDDSLKHTREKRIFEVDTFEKFRCLHDVARLFILNPEGKESVMGTQL